MTVIGIMKRSLAELDKSLSCHRDMFSKDVYKLDFRILAND